MKISLRPVAISDLSLRYARDMGENQLRHYRVNLVDRMLSDSSPIELIKEHILRTEGKEESEFEILVEPSLDLLQDPNGKPMFVEEVSHMLDTPIREALEKFEANSQYVEVVDDLTFKDKAVNLVAKCLNPFIFRLNRLILKVKGISTEEFGFIDMSTMPIPEITVRHPLRRVNMAHYISVAFEAPDYKQAFNALQHDLRLLHENDLITGNLSMPRIIQLADTVGSGVKTYAFFCFPILSSKRLDELLGNPIERPRDPLPLLSLQHSTFEGSIKWLHGISPDQKYKIEVVDIFAEKRKEREELVRKSYEDSIPKVTEAADATRAMLKAYPEELAKAQKELDAAVEAAGLKTMRKLTKRLSKKVKKKVIKKTRKTAKKKVRRK